MSRVNNPWDANSLAEESSESSPLVLVLSRVATVLVVSSDICHQTNSTVKIHLELVRVLAQLPEIGKLSREKISKLVGLAPLNRDSGNSSGRRFIMGGRGQVRSVLYMSTLVAIGHN